MRKQCSVIRTVSEQAGYVEVAGNHLYTVLHEVTDPVARILLVGPFASERHFSYIPWVRWARFLAARGIETLRFDYRGVGESTGIFEEMTFQLWNDDVKYLVGWLKSRPRNVPLILHGLELGALLASNVFPSGDADGMLLWSAPSNANEILRKGLLRRIAVDHTVRSERRTLSDYVGDLEGGRSVEVEGYKWSARLWHDSFEFELSVPKANDLAMAGGRERPVRIIPLDRRAAPLVKGSSLGYVVCLNPDLSALFAETFQWIENMLATVRGNVCEERD